MIHSLARRRLPYLLTLVSCIQFVALTLLAMPLYPGGTVADETTRGYSFSANFFSDLGRTVAANGSPNTASFVLFVAALALAGIGLVVYFVAAPRWFRPSRWGFALSILGSLFGVVAGICFVGVACTPADLYLGPHARFVVTAFESLLGAAVLYAAVILAGSALPRRYAAVYGLFALLLGGYVALMTHGPGLATAGGVRTQAIGQKVIVYAGILCMCVQSAGMLRLPALRAGRR